MPPDRVPQTELGGTLRLILVRPMRVVLVITVVLVVGLSRAHAVGYYGIVVRASDSRPIAGMMVSAFLRQPWYSALIGPIADIRLGERVTDSHGAFHFDLPQSSSRLVFTVSSGKMTRRRVDASTTLIYGRGASLKHPSARRLNILRVPD